MPDPLPQDLASKLQSQAIEGKLVNMSNYDCIQTYRAGLVSDYSNVILVSSNTSTNNSILAVFEQIPTTLVSSNVSVGWICGYSNSQSWVSQCDINSSSWGWTAPPPPQYNLTGSELLYYKFNNTYGISSGYPILIDYCLLQDNAALCSVQLIPGQFQTLLPLHSKLIQGRAPLIYVPQQS
jgi:hypothetical protein